MTATATVPVAPQQAPPMPSTIQTSANGASRSIRAFAPASSRSRIVAATAPSMLLRNSASSGSERKPSSARGR